MTVSASTCAGGAAVSDRQLPITGGVPAITVALIGDIMLAGRVQERIRRGQPIVDDGVRHVLSQAALTVGNLECCLTSGGARWPDPTKRFSFRAGTMAAAVLAGIGVDAVCLANNHTLDFGESGLRDTITALRDAGVEPFGAGYDVTRARAPVVLPVAGRTVAFLGVTDHPADFAAGHDRPGVAYADLRYGVPAWLSEQLAHTTAACDVTVALPHWGPNFVPTPRPYVLAAGAQLVDAGASLVAGHSAHLIQSCGDRVIYDMGDFVDDYPMHPLHRAHLGAVWLVDLAPSIQPRIRAMPTVIHDACVHLAAGADWDFTYLRLRDLCEQAGATVTDGPDGALHVTAAARSGEPV